MRLPGTRTAITERGTAMSERHVLQSWTYDPPKGPVSFAVCDLCSPGWRGPDRASDSAALSDYRQHINHEHPLSSASRHSPS